MITIVSGAPRSGTSLMMQMLVAGGMEALTDGVRVSDADNERGYFEWELVKKLPREPHLIAAAEGKAVKVISSLLSYLPQGRNYKVIFMTRGLDAVLASQAVMISRKGTQGAALGKDAMKAALSSHLAQAMAAAGRRHGADLLSVAYEDLVAEPGLHAGRVASFLGLGLDTSAMTAAADPSLCHHGR